MKNEKCYKLKFKGDNDIPVILFGRIISNTDNEVTIETGSGKQYSISKKSYFFLQETNKIFKRS